VRRGGWWYHTDIDAKKRWYGEPWGGPDTHLARPFFVQQLEERIKQMTEWANDPNADLVAAVGKAKTREQIVPIMDGLTNNNEGYFQVNVPNHGALEGLPDDLVVEVPAIVNQKGIQPIRVGKLPPKIMYGHILPDWLDTERELLAFKTGDRSLLLYNVLDHHQTKSYDQAAALLDELLELGQVKEIEDWEKMKRISDYYQYPASLRERDGGSK
jgi:alpha-galactosidase